MCQGVTIIAMTIEQAGCSATGCHNIRNEPRKVCLSSSVKRCHRTSTAPTRTSKLSFAVSVTSNLNAGVTLSVGVPCAEVGPISLTLLSWTAVINVVPSPSSLRHLRSVEERVQTRGKCYWLQEQSATAASASASFHFWVKWTDASLISSFIDLHNLWRDPIRTNLLATFRQTPSTDKHEYLNL